MRKTIMLLGVVAAMASLSACRSSKATGFGNRNAPNEFAVNRAPPLVIPPDFSLRPPRPGAPRPQETAPSAQALAVMFGGQAQTSPGQEAIIGAAGGAPDAGIRSSAGDPKTTVADKGVTTKNIVSAPAGNGQNTPVSTPQ